MSVRRARPELREGRLPGPEDDGGLSVVESQVRLVWLLSTERDLLTLLEMILTQARRISASDAGSVYLVERDEDGVAGRLRFKLSQNFSLPNLPFSESTVAIDHHSLSGYVAATAQPLVIADVNGDGAPDLIVGNTDEAPPPLASRALNAQQEIRCYFKDCLVFEDGSRLCTVKEVPCEHET